MRQIDNMTSEEIDILHLKGMLSTTAETSNQQTWDQQGEHDRDLEHESRVDYASWETDQPDFE